MIDFFSNFPKLEYPVDEFSKQASNLAVGELVFGLLVDESYVLWRKDLADDDTPVSIAADVYNDTSLYWTIIYVNNIINPYTDWFMGQKDLEVYTAAKYQTGMMGLHHFENRANPNRPRILDDVDHAAALAIYNVNPAGLGQYIIPVTNLQYEREKNEARRSIRIINPKFIPDFSENFHRIMRGGE